MPGADALEPRDQLLAAVVRQAIRDLQSGPKSEREASQEYLAQLGLLDEAGEVVRAAVADVGLVWPPQPA
jgi:hypothetical protein